MAAQNPTPDESLPPDGLSDEELARMLQEAVGVEAPREDFVVSLAAQLEAELEQVWDDNADISNDAGSDTTAVETQVSVANLPEEASGVDDSCTDRPSSEQHGRGWLRTGRSLVAFVSAAVIVLSVVIWSSQPTYSWTLMLEALESQPWVESFVEQVPAEEERSMLVQPNRIEIVRRGRDVIWNDLNGGIRSLFHAESGMLLRGRPEEPSTASVEQSLLAFLLSASSETESTSGRRIGPEHDVVVLNQSWRTLGAGEEQQIELNVILGLSSDPADTIHLIAILDPQTRLPQTCYVIGRNAEAAETVRFEYPIHGPQEVYDVGVPRDAVVRHVESFKELERPLVAQRESDLARVVADSDNPEPPFGQPTAEQTAQKTTEPDSNKKTAAIPDSLVNSSVVSSTNHSESFRLIPPADLPSSANGMSRRLDALMATFWERSSVTGAETCNDEEYFRRIYLDLSGRIPTVSEYRAFHDSTIDKTESSESGSGGERQQLVEDLLNSRDHATHLGAVWRRMLLPEGADLTAYGGFTSFESWLAERFGDNMSYDRIVTELLLAEGRVSESGPILFYTALNLKPEELAAQTSRAFLGIRLECAQCHDHFFDKRLKQEDFWGFAAFFARISQPTGKMNAVSPVLRVADADRGEVTMPDSDDVIAPRHLLGESVADDSAAPGRRQQLASWITAADNPHFARATVNRVWAHLFGRGLVEPVDDMRIDNPALCPEVLDELASYFVASGFDLRNLFRVIVNSQTYQRTSRSVDDDTEQATHFARMNIKTFTAEQLYDSISVATRVSPLESQDGSLARFQNMNRRSFLSQFQAPAGQATDYQAGIPQALTLMNGVLIQSATHLESSGVLRSLQAPFFTDEQRLETLYLSTLSRLPDEDEREAMLEYVLADDEARNQRFTDVLWALLNSAEFTLNH